MRISIGAIRNVAGLLFGFGCGLILMSPTVSALSMVPGLFLLAPSNSSNVSGTITFAAAADAEGLSSLQFQVDGSNFGSPITAGSCRATYDTRQTSDGPHTVQAIGRDEFGNAAYTQPATIFVNNVAPAISNLIVSNVTSSSATINWGTAAIADGRVDYGVTMSYGGSTYDSGVGTSHVVTLGGLTAGATYHFSAVSFGQNGILSASGDYVFTTAGAPGAPAPSPAPTPTPGFPTPTPSPSPGLPTPSPTPISPAPTPTSPTPAPSPSPTPTSSGTRGRTAPSGSDLGGAVPRTDATALSPTPEPVLTGTAAIRGGGLTNTVVLGGSGTGVSRSTGTSSIGVSGFSGIGGGSLIGPTTIAAPTVGTSTSTPQKRGSQSSTRTDPKSTDPQYTPCAGPNPFINEGLGSCVNGTWIRQDPGNSTSGSTTSSTAATSASTTTTTSETPAVQPAPTTTAAAPTTPTTTSGSTGATVAVKPKSVSSCSMPDPFAAKGGLGLCVNGEWVLLWKSKGK